MKKVILVVEGDYDLQILPQLVPSGVLVIRGAGKYGMRAFMEGYQKAPGATSSDKIFAFRDRDFDYPMADAPELHTDRNIFVSHRRTIENYLLTPEAYASFYTADSSKNSAVFSVDEFRDLLIESAKKIKYYQAARQTLGEMREANRLNTTWTTGSGNLPEQLDRVYCAEMAQKALEKYKKTSLDIADTDRFQEFYNRYCDLFDDTFFADQMHQTWFQAKDLQKELTRMMSSKTQSFPWKTFYKTAINHFDYTQFSDLVQLRETLSEYTA